MANNLDDDEVARGVVGVLRQLVNKAPWHSEQELSDAHAALNAIDPDYVEPVDEATTADTGLVEPPVDAGADAVSPAYAPGDVAPVNELDNG